MDDLSIVYKHIQFNKEKIYNYSQEQIQEGTRELTSSSLLEVDRQRDASPRSTASSWYLSFCSFVQTRRILDGRRTNPFVPSFDAREQEADGGHG